jgi:DNA/RNA-binding domain of Phe-tRNA-synthetase-like protein
MKDEQRTPEMFKTLSISQHSKCPLKHQSVDLRKMDEVCWVYYRDGHNTILTVTIEMISLIIEKPHSVFTTHVTIQEKRMQEYSGETIWKL